MTGSDPPRPAVALLRRLAGDHAPLVGDLLERFAVRPSRLRFWREVLAAIVIHAFERRDREHPLGLGDRSGSDLEGRVSRTDALRPVNLTASPIPGIGGLGLVALGVVVALARPHAWWMFVPALVGGAALGLTLVLVRRRAVLSGPVRAPGTLLRNTEQAGSS